MEKLELLTNREEFERVWNMQKILWKISLGPGIVVGLTLFYLERYQPEIFSDILEKVNHYFPSPYTLIESLFS